MSEITKYYLAIKTTFRFEQFPDSEYEGYEVGILAVWKQPNEDVYSISHIETAANVVAGMCFTKRKAIKIAREMQRIFTPQEWEASIHFHKTGEKATGQLMLRDMLPYLKLIYKDAK